jgi:hypothetical protein
MKLTRSGPVDTLLWPGSGEADCWILVPRMSRVPWNLVAARRVIRPPAALRARIRRCRCWSATWAGWWSPTRRRHGRSPRPRSRPTRSTRQCWRRLLAADDLPAVWLPDDRTHALRRQVIGRAHVVRQRTRLKNQVQSILHRNLIPRWAAADLFGTKGRACWPPRIYQQMSSRRSGRCCANSTSTPKSFGSWTPSSAGPPWSTPRSAGCCPSRGGRHRGPGDRGRGRRLRSPLLPAAAGELSGPQPAGAPVRRPAFPARPDHHPTPGPRPRHAGRGCLGRG